MTISTIVFCCLTVPVRREFWVCACGGLENFRVFSAIPSSILVAFIVLSNTNVSVSSSVQTGLVFLPT